MCHASDKVGAQMTVNADPHGDLRTNDDGDYSDHEHNRGKAQGRDYFLRVQLEDRRGRPNLQVGVFPCIDGERQALHLVVADRCTERIVERDCRAAVGDHLGAIGLVEHRVVKIENELVISTRGLRRSHSIRIQRILDITRAKRLGDVDLSILYRILQRGLLSVDHHLTALQRDG